jgi:N-acetyl-anhydromuramyl-L-alanine amidase AmpD
MSLDITKINQQELTVDQYIREDCSALKNQIYLHHSAGGSSAKNVIHGWQSNPEDVATAFIICGKPSSKDTHKDGDIYQAFGSKYWAYHLAFSKNTNKIPSKYHNFTYEQKIARGSIGIEITSWGQLTKGTDGVFRSYVNTIVPSDEVITFENKYRGFSYYHAYTDAQISSLKDLLIYLCDKYKISKKFNADMFDINLRALDGENGIFSHTSVRVDKNDICPQPKLIKMLQEIEQGI